MLFGKSKRGGNTFILQWNFQGGYIILKQFPQEYGKKSWKFHIIIFDIAHYLLNDVLTTPVPVIMQPAIDQSDFPWDYEQMRLHICLSLSHPVSVCYSRNRGGGGGMRNLKGVNHSYQIPHPPPPPIP